MSLRAFSQINTLARFGNLFTIIFTLLYFTALLVENNAKKIPDYVPVCKKSNSDFDKCVLNAIQVVRPYLAKGIPKMRVPASEPLVIPSLEIIRDLESLRVNAKLMNIKAYGASSFDIKRLKIDVKKLSLNLNVNIPHLYVTCDYDVNGRLLIVPLKGKGHFKGNLTNTEAEIKGSAKKITNKKGTEYLEIENITSKIKVGDTAVSFINEDKENAIIMETAGNFINQNRKQVLQIISPIVEETAEAFIQQIGNAIFRSIPLTELLPE